MISFKTEAKKYKNIDGKNIFKCYKFIKFPSFDYIL